MKKVLSILKVLVLVFLLCGQVYAIYELINVKYKINSVSSDIISLLQAIKGQDENFEIQVETVNDLMETVSLKLDKCESQFQEYYHSLKKSIETQSLESKNTRETFKAILDEQKNKSIDIASKDEFIKRKKEEGVKFIKQNDYSSAFKIYDEILLYQENDLEIRFIRMKCLYYSNPSDSRNYSNILNECSILQANGYSNSELTKIQKAVMREMGKDYE